jgi:hypothetical protein
MASMKKGPELPDYFGGLGDEDEKWYLRIFFNVDEQPRLWNVSHSLTGVAERVRHP